MKLATLFLTSMLMYGASVHASDDWALERCDKMSTQLSDTTYNLTQLRQMLYLQQLDLGSYNPDQHTSVEYINLQRTYNTAVENYNAIATSHNRLMTIHTRTCYEE